MTVRIDDPLAQRRYDELKDCFPFFKILMSNFEGVAPVYNVHVIVIESKERTESIRHMDTLLRSLGVLSVAVLFVCDGSGGTTTDHGHVQLFRESFSQIHGGYYSTAEYTYLDSGFSNGGSGDSHIQLRISLRMPRLQPGEEQVVAEGALLMIDAFSLCREKGYIDNVELKVRRDEGVYCFSGDVVAVTVSCETTGGIRSVSSTGTLETCVGEEPKIVSYINDDFFDLHPKCGDWKRDLSKRTTEHEGP